MKLHEIQTRSDKVSDMKLRGTNPLCNILRVKKTCTLDKMKSDMFLVLTQLVL